MPRPSPEIPMAASPVNVRLRSDVDQVVKALAEREGNTRSAVVRRLVADALRAEGNDTRPAPELTTTAAEGRG
jgi:predicted transcriptional regulator